MFEVLELGMDSEVWIVDQQVSFGQQKFSNCSLFNKEYFDFNYII